MKIHHDAHDVCLIFPVRREECLSDVDLMKLAILAGNKGRDKRNELYHVFSQGFLFIVTICINEAEHVFSSVYRSCQYVAS